MKAASLQTQKMTPLVETKPLSSYQSQVAFLKPTNGYWVTGDLTLEEQQLLVDKSITTVYDPMDVDTKSWPEFHDVGFCLVLADVKVAGLLRAVVASEIFHKTRDSANVRRYIEQWWNNINISAIDQQMYLTQSFLVQCNNIDKIIASKRSKAVIDNWSDSFSSEILKKLRRFLPEYVSPAVLKEWELTASSGTSFSLLSLPKASKDVPANKMLKNYFQYDKIQDLLVLALIEQLIGSIGIHLHTLAKSTSLKDYKLCLKKIVNLRNDVIHKSTDKLLDAKEATTLYKLYQSFVNGFPFADYYPYNHELKVSQFD